jgi:hemolysin activation/secretion protein
MAHRRILLCRLEYRGRFLDRCLGRILRGSLGFLLAVGYGTQVLAAPGQGSSTQSANDGSLDATAAVPNQGGGSAAEPRFDVWEYRVSGNSALSPRELETVIYPHLGPQRSMSDVEAVREKLEALYRDRGFGAVYVDIPEQEVVDGLVRLTVTEGKVGRVKISGARYFSSGSIRNSLPSLTAGNVVDLNALQQDLGQINRKSADRQVTPVLRAGAVPGSVDVELKVKDAAPLHGSIDVNDRYTADTSRTRLGINLSYDNLFQKFHRLSLQYQTAPEEPAESRVIAATYVVPLEHSDDLVAAYVVDTRSDFATIAGLGSLSVLGTGRIYGLRYINPLPEGRGLSQSLTLGLDYKDFEDRIVQPGGLTDVTPMQYINWSASYGATWRGEAQTTSLTAALNFGIRGLGNSPDEFEYKRYKGKPNYLYLRASVDHERPFVAGTRVLARVAAQAALNPLISNEQFAIGGAATVRGYLEAEQLGDNGLAATVELHSPSLVSLLPEHLQQAYVFGFVDAGLVGILDPLPIDGEKTSSYSLASVGLGLRVNAFGGLQTELEWAYPMRSSSNVDRGDSRLHFQVMYGF